MAKAKSGGAPGGKPDRRAQFLNINFNVAIVMSILMMKTMGSALGEALGSTTEAVGEAMGAEKAEAKTAAKEVKKEVKETFDVSLKEIEDLRATLESQRKERKASFDATLAKIPNSTLDEGIAIVDKYDFGLPKFTENLGSQDLLAYIKLGLKEDKEFKKMWDELYSWMQTVPKPEGVDD